MERDALRDWEGSENPFSASAAAARSCADSSRSKTPINAFAVLTLPPSDNARTHSNRTSTAGNVIAALKRASNSNESIGLCHLPQLGYRFLRRLEPSTRSKLRRLNVPGCRRYLRVLGACQTRRSRHRVRVQRYLMVQRSWVCCIWLDAAAPFVLRTFPLWISYVLGGGNPRFLVYEAVATSTPRVRTQGTTRVPKTGSGSEPIFFDVVQCFIDVTGDHRVLSRVRRSRRLR